MLSPTPAGTSYAALTAVGCLSQASCVAVGFAEKGGVNSVLTERWNGVAWSVVPAPRPRLNKARSPER